MDWIETFGAQEENGKHYSRLWCTGCWVQTKNRIKKTKKESVFSPSHLLASSALFRSLSGRASSQSSIVLISFPLLKKERIHSHTSKWIRVHCFKNTVKARVYLHALSPRDRITSQYRPVGFSPITPITFSLTYCLEHQDLCRLHLHLTRSLLVELWLKGENCSFFFFFVNVASVLLVHLIIWNIFLQTELSTQGTKKNRSNWPWPNFNFEAVSFACFHLRHCSFRTLNLLNQPLACCSAVVWRHLWHVCVTVSIHAQLLSKQFFLFIQKNRLFFNLNAWKHW